MRSISVPELAETLDSAQIVDVREPDETATGHIEGARLIPLSTFVEHVDEIDPERDVYLICARGGRSAQAAQYLESRGFDTVNVEGGMVEWNEQQRPVVS